MSQVLEGAVRIAVYAFDEVTLFHLAVPQMVFDEVRRLGLADWHTSLFSDVAGSIRSVEGLAVGPVAGPEAAGDADLIVIPSWFTDGRSVAPGTRDTVLRAHAGGAAVAGLCLGAIAVADIGLLDGRAAATHWSAASQLAERHPEISVDASVLYVDHGDVLTSAGMASGLDACLHIVRTRLGAEAANHVARSMVIASHREGGQAQFIERPVAVTKNDDPVGRACSWAERHLETDLSIDALATKARMSRRSFIRAFQESRGVTPAAWVRSVRLDEARRLLETTDLPIDQVAVVCGFGSSATFRQNFSNAFASAPSRYRSRFSTQTVPAVEGLQTPFAHAGTIRSQ